MTSNEDPALTKRCLKLSKTTAYPVIERYFSSGELPSTFYRREGLTEHQFYKWRKYYLQDHPSLATRLGLDDSSRRSRKCPGKTKSRKSAKQGAPSRDDTGFGRIVAADTAATCGRPLTGSGVWEIGYPNGVCLRIGSETPFETVARLIFIPGL